MKKLIFTLLIFFIPTIYSNHPSPDFNFEGDILFTNPYLFVSLGCNCWQAQALRSKQFGLRDAAFPFDWLFTNKNDKLIKCLDEKFEYFSDPTCFVRYAGTHVKNERYSFKFTHDWPYKTKQITNARHNGQLNFIKEKYERRIARFNNIKKFKGKVFFIRCFQTNPNYQAEPGWNAQKAQDLHDALKRYFSKIDFTLVIVSCTDPNVSEIGDIPDIKEYKIRNLTAPNFAEFEFMYNDLLASLQKNPL